MERLRSSVFVLGPEQPPENVGLDAVLRDAGDTESLPVRLAMDRMRQRLFDVDPAPRVLGRFELIDVVGRGATGVVHSAYDPKLNRTVALKVFPGPVEGTTSARVRREARLAASLNHPNIVTIHDVGESGGRLWVAMDLVEGQSLGQWLRTVPCEWEDLAPFFLPIAAGLDAAHQQGVVHRDVKPDNILVGAEGRVVLVDFGVASITSKERAPAAKQAMGGGTPAYMSPEQLQGGEVGPGSDQFSFCVTLFEAFTGRRPFSGRTTAEILDQMRAGPEGPLSRADIPRRVSAVLARGLSLRPASRFPSMAALADALRLKRRRGGAALLAGAGLAFVAAAAWPPRSEACGGESSKMAAVWSEEQRATVSSAFESQQTPFARETWTRVESVLDERAAGWVNAHREACESSVAGRSSDLELDARMRCLATQRVELEATVEVLEGASETTVDRASQLVSALPGAEGCLDVSTNDEPEPASPAVTALHHAILGAEVVSRAGEYARSSELAGSLAVDAAALGQRGLQAHALMLQGTSLLQLAQVEEAAGLLERALFMAMAEDDGMTLVQAATNLVATESTDLRAKERWMSYAKTRVARGGVPPRLQASVLEQEGTMLVLSGDRRGGTQKLEAAYAILDEHDTLQSDYGARLILNLAQLAMVEERFVEAESKQRRALEIYEAVLGPAHPKTGVGLAALATVLIPLRKEDEAEALLRRAMDVFAGSVGVQHPYFSRSRGVLGALLLQRGDFVGARALFVEILAALEREHPQGHPDLAMPLQNLATIDAYEGKLEAAASSHARIVAMARESGADPVALARPLHGFSGVRMLQRDLEGASVLLQECIDMVRSSDEFSAAERSKYLARLAEVRLLQGRYSDAASLFEEVRAIDAEALEAQDGRRRRALVGIGATANAQGRHRIALEALEAAAELDEKGADLIELARAEIELASSLLSAEDDAGRALELGRSARRHLEQAPAHEVAAAAQSGLLDRDRLGALIRRAKRSGAE